ncbi:putative isoflavone reductase like protein P3 [Dactylonectria macrodidyma]|uniref:Isoflavone reductase like protein P3 n=1 Tax=Dactylonectria macrodidyma TaxID=307937 RepID=A0A9P9DCK0_9HYPO|nr:putative isoflavone reductase like protein P3 [Dactylonectria macrodidyma]
MGSIADQQIINVAVAGGTGILGSLVLKSLLQSGRFNVTILGRSERNHRPIGVKLAVVDYNDSNSLVEALKGQDAVVSTLSREATLLQLSLIDAAVTAGVKRFIPSEFGGNLQNPNSRQLLNYKEKVQVKEHLEKKSKTHEITYTYIYNNVFMDWAIETGILLNLKHAKIHLYDGGERQVSMITMPTAAQAVVAILLHPEETKNRPVCIHEAFLSQKQLLAFAKEVAPDREWREEYVDLQELERKAMEQQRPGVPNMSIFHAFAVKGGFGEGFGNQFSEADNKLLGIQPLSANGIKDMLTTMAKKWA